jgi:hypothetical protein
VRDIAACADFSQVKPTGLFVAVLEYSWVSGPACWDTARHREVQAAIIAEFKVRFWREADIEQADLTTA